MSKCFIEEIEEGLHLTYTIKKLLNSAQSKFQQVEVAETGPFGRCLIIDGLMQSSDIDEHVYHECLVHPSLLAHPNPKTVFIGGGGEGGTARECLRHKGVEKVVMVDIDGDVVNFCKANLPQNTAAFADPRLELIIDDAKARIEGYPPASFDVIIMDLDDPIEGGPCYWLYTKDFYETCKTKLTPGGILVTQCSAAGVKSHSLVWSPVNNTMKQVFKKVHPYSQAVYSFCDEWGWSMGSDDEATLERLSEAEIDKRIGERLSGDLKFLDGCSYQGLFCLSKQHRKTLAEETRVLSVENPAFLSTGTSNKGLGHVANALPSQ